MRKTHGSGVDRLPFKTKFAFGVGSGAEALVLYSVSQYAIFYYNQVLGLPAHLAGLAVSASLLFDAMSDPIVGSLSDRTNSRLGRRHPYMFAAPIPIVLAFLAVFNPPAGLGDWGLFAWFMVAVIFMRQAMTFFHTPHLAFGGELSRDYTERSKVMAYNSFFSWAGGAAVTWIALSYFFKATPEYPRGLLNPEPYAPYALTLGAICLLVLFGSAWFTRDRIPYLPKPAPNLPKFSPMEFFRDISKAFGNRNYVWLLVAYFFLSCMLGLRLGLHLYTNTFYWQLSSEQLRWFVIGSFAGYAAAFYMAARLHGRYDKKRVMIISSVIFALMPGLPLMLGTLGIMTPGMPFLLETLIFFAVIQYGAMSVLSISVMSALADIADENELKHNLRQEGILYSTRALAAKVDQAIGSALAGFVLMLIAFPEKAQPGEVSPEVLHQLAMWEGWYATIPGLIAAYFYAKYGINKDSFEATRAALAERRGAEISAPIATAASAGVNVAEPVVPEIPPSPARG